MGGTVPAIRAGAFRIVTGSPSLDEQPRTPASRSAAIVLVTSIVYPLLRREKTTGFLSRRMCHILTRVAAILRVKGFTTLSPRGRISFPRFGLFYFRLM